MSEPKGGSTEPPEPPLDPPQGKAVNLEYRTIRLFYRSENVLCFVLRFGCIPRDVKGVYCLIGQVENSSFLIIHSQTFKFPIEYIMLIALIDPGDHEPM